MNKKQNDVNLVIYDMKIYAIAYCEKYRLNLKI